MLIKWMEFELSTFRLTGNLFALPLDLQAYYCRSIVWKKYILFMTLLVDVNDVIVTMRCVLFN